MARTPQRTSASFASSGSPRGGSPRRSLSFARAPTAARGARRRPDSPRPSTVASNPAPRRVNLFRYTYPTASARNLKDSFFINALDQIDLSKVEIR